MHWARALPLGLTGVLGWSSSLSLPGASFMSDRLQTWTWDLRTRETPRDPRDTRGAKL